MAAANHCILKSVFFKKAAAALHSKCVFVEANLSYYHCSNACWHSTVPSADSCSSSLVSVKLPRCPDKHELLEFIIPVVQAALSCQALSQPGVEIHAQLFVQQSSATLACIAEE